MVRTKLRQLLAKHGITPYRFAKTVEAQGERSRSWAYRTVRGEIGLTTEGIDLIIRCLRELTGQPITVEDVMGYVDEADKSADADGSQQEARVWDLLLKRDEMRGDALSVLAPEVIPEATYQATYRPGAPPRRRRWWLASLLLVFLLGAGSQRTYQFTLDRRERILLSQPTPTPVQIGPEGDIQSAIPKLRVDPVEGATDYEYSVFNLNSRQNVLNENTDAPFFIVPASALCAGAPYGWSAKASRGGAWSSFSSRMEFTVEGGEMAQAMQATPPETPRALAPQEVVSTLTPTLEVAPVKDATGYGFYLKNLDTDQVYEYEYAATAPAFKLPEGLVQDGGRYRWNARARNYAGFSMGYTDTLEFRVDLR